MKKFLTITLLTCGLLACSQSNQEKTNATTDETATEAVVGNRLLTLEIEGMTCVMGCGGTIQSELAATKAIESCEFDFEQGRAKNVAKIAFDQNKISADKIIKIVSHLNEGQFKVEKEGEQDISVNIRTRVEEMPSDRLDDSKMKVAAESTSMAMPNIIEIMASFFHN